MSNHNMSSSDRNRRKRSLFTRYGCHCYHCDNCFPIQQLTLDHLTPRSRGGSNALSNLRLACSSYNNRRGAALI
ncbi:MULTISPECIES: HNH endonuclease [Trichocoleus]|uniref:HNH endonuclease n=1 Tax=Trichocoleus desertorum GB2-A4 TaxID=2933944 RepID=A0ABV0JFD1_9CYAN|nr:HNH endonuclease [Trichocoleus sp. FACHB-46]MBD1864551.1 HNH endonuclease [Trichocoleus sp. FACHB-46]